MGKQQNYTDQFKAGAIIMLESQGYPHNDHALAIVGKHLGVHPRTLKRWATGDSGAPPDKLVQDTKKGFTDLIEDEIRDAFRAMAGARGDASYRDLVIGAATLFDKLQLLLGNPTDRTEVDVTHGISDDLQSEVLGKLRRIAASGSADGVYRQSDDGAT